MDINWDEERAGFIAGEIGVAVIELISARTLINRDNIVESLEARRKTAGNTVHKGILHNSAMAVRKGV
ncbi:hypothetical protein [Yersinia bercovieri]|uniref:hypothetical protein n=1 Tax=Yersinia bercovieri TaxID=634 RepID=UPI0011AB45BF|nr:hypothetical protein [Yersinia bercovieri]